MQTKNHNWKTFDDLDLTEYYRETPYRAMNKGFFERIIKQFKKEAIKAGIAGDIKVTTKNVPSEKSPYGSEGDKFSYVETEYRYKKNIIFSTLWLVSN
jgi:hypothetical protein